MLETIQVSTILPANAERIYRAWLDGHEHAAFTGSEASVDARIGGKFSAWDGYIQGTTLRAEPNRRIVQSWRTSDFPADSSDSRLEVLLEELEPENPNKASTRITLLHTDIPEGQGPDYQKGWEDFYFEPMQAYFSGQEG